MNEIPNDKCSICEQTFERVDLELVALKHSVQGYSGPNDPPIFWACNACATKEKLNFYHTKWIEAGEAQSTKIIVSNLFRTLMLSNESILAQSNESETSVRSYLLQHQAGWEKLPLDSMLFFLNLLHAHAQFFADMINKKATQEEIKAHLISKTEKAKKDDVKKLVDQRKKETGLVGEYTKDERRAILGLMKGPMKCTEKAAYEMICGVIKDAQAKK
jgi:hypothetical protein